MIITGVARLGRDCEVRFTPNGDAVTNLSLAFNYGQKDQQTGQKPTMWIEASLWGKRAESLAPYLVKGTQLSIVAEEPHIETYKGQNGPGHKLVARILTIDFAGPPPDRQDGQQGGGQQQGRQQPQQGQQRQQPQQGGVQQRQAPQGQQRQAPQQNQQRQQPQGGGAGGYGPGGSDSGFDSMDSDIPFVDCSMIYDMESKLDRRIRKSRV